MSEATQALTLDFSAIGDADTATSTKEEAWGRLISLNPAYGNVDLAGDQYKMGRQSSCEIRFDNTMNMISGTHCRLYRERPNSQDAPHLTFVQDLR